MAVYASRKKTWYYPRIAEAHFRNALARERI